jgi:DNA polymerase-1
MAGTVLIDADIIVHTLVHASTRSYEWAKNDVTTVSDERAARLRCDDMVRDVIRATECSRAILCLSDMRHNWRKRVMPTYKANRKGKPKPIGFSRLRSYIRETYACREFPTLEADDVLGLLMTSERAIKGRRVCASLDKDLLTIPGLHYQWRPTKTTGMKVGVFTVSKKEAVRRFALQILMGDAVDGYPGIPGVGPKKAEKYLGDLETMEYFWPRIVETYEEVASMTTPQATKAALKTAQVARILQVGEYSQRSGVKLWSPPA